VADITIDVQPGPIVTVEFEGDPLPADRREELVPVEQEGSVDEDLLEDSERRIAGYLQQQGYWKATAGFARKVSDGRMTIVITVRRGLQYRIANGVEITGNPSVPIEQLRPLIENLAAGEVYLSANLDAAVAGIRELYRTRGFARVKVDPAVNEITPDSPGLGLVRPVIAITEGPMTTIGGIAFAGNTAIGEQELRAVVRSAPGQPYYEPHIIADGEALLLRYRNLGFASASAEAVLDVSPDGSRVTVRFEIQEGPQTLVDHIIVVGNTRTDPQVILRELLLKSGEPLGLEDQIESRRRLNAVGLFRRVQITPISHGSADRQDVLVTVEEAPPTTYGYGGGVEASKLLRATGPDREAQERFEFAPRGFFEIGRRNLGGKNRAVNLYTRLGLRPDRTVDEGARSGNFGFGFSEYRVVVTYREPRAFGVPADLTVTGAVEQGVRTSFNFARKGINAELIRRISPGVRASGRYSLGTTRTFDEQLSEQQQATIDRLFPQVRLSAFSGAIARDTRDDVLEPTRGGFLSAEGSLASRGFGGQVGFLKSYMQAFWFRLLPGSQRIVFATRVAVGLADGFSREVESTDPEGNPIVEIIEDLPASERFFAGGDMTIRGFALDAVGTPGTISPTGFPRGGNAVLILNGELRLPVWRDLGAAVFVDGGNVFERVTQVDLGALRGSLGFGVRYRSPIGPVRLDLGFKMDRRMVGGNLEGRRAIHFSIGQAF
jgi:outer membrane protein assembly complex protein YaeT